MDLIKLPQNVIENIALQMGSSDRIRLALTNKTMFQHVIGSVYHTIIYQPSSEYPIIKRNDNVIDNVTLINDGNITLFFATISRPSVLNFYYSDLVIELYLEKISHLSAFDLVSWRQTQMPHFSCLERYQFPEEISIPPITFQDAPNLNTLIVDRNFCDYLDHSVESINFLHSEKIQNMYIKGVLGRNEDMTMFKLLTRNPQMIRHLQELHFLVDRHENYEVVYRRIVGFFAILRKMNLGMHQVHKLSVTLTNRSSSSIISLISKHIIFENLSELTLFIQDDGKVLTLVKSLDRLTNIIRYHGSNIRKLNLRYDLVGEDIEKNHLRSMMLLKLCESFQNLTHLNYDLKISGLNFSNMLMILGSPITNNIKSIIDLRINVYQPSENLVGNIVSTLEEAMQLFPYLNFLNRCNCLICQSIVETLALEADNSPLLFDETIKVSTLLIIGQELDMAQRLSESSINSSSVVNKHSSCLRKDDYPKNGFLFDHLINLQLNHSLNYLPNLKNFELCGLMYKRVVYGFHNSTSHYNHHFDLLYGNEFRGLEDTIVSNIMGMGHIFRGNIRLR